MKKVRQGLKALKCVVILSITVLIFNACSKSTPANISTFAATLNGSQAEPPNSETGTGFCNVTYDSIANKLAYTITWEDLTGAPTEVEFENETTGSEISLDDFPAKTNGGISGYVNIADADESDLLHNNFYVNIKTAAHGDGEIRGQLKKN